MSNKAKQVYATLKFDDDKLQILVAEYFNTRFNIIGTYSADIEGIADYKIIDEAKLIEEIRTGIDAVSVKIGARLEKAVVIIPPFNFKRISLKVSVVTEDGRIRKSDVARAITNSLKTNVGNDLVVINTLISKYTINGISSRRFNEFEVCDDALIDIDLLCADKEMTYSYVRAVSEAGLEVLDLTLNNYAICKESVLLDNSINRNIILLDIGRNITYLTLLSKGRLISSEIIYDGLGNLCNEVYNAYHLPRGIIPRLVKYSVDFDSPHPGDAVFAWNSEDKPESITVKELSDLIEKPLNDFLDKIMVMCKPIIEEGADLWICGEGSSMEALVKRLREASGCEVKAYYPDTIGARDTELCAVYGALYVYKEKANMNSLNVNCVDMIRYEKIVDQIEEDVEGESITSKIKSLFEIYRDRDKEDI
ncbi:MAG: hypothetical protein IJJ00_02195 [Erysipelotrichaceae bacterium]|nr:hypothetical protein [Erysipelotrichaceae bacterium]